MKTLQFNCQKCQNKVDFSFEKIDEDVVCPHCQQKYQLNDATLKKQLKKFIDLCETIKNAEDILSDTCVGVDVGDQHVEIPYKLLLTRLNTSLDIKLGDKPLRITFRMEPLEKFMKM